MTRQRWTNARYRSALTLLLIGAALCYIIGNAAAPLFDRDEPRYAVTSLNMLESGDWVTPRLLGEVRTAKPPAIYWLQASSIAVFGKNAFAVRLPGTVGVLLTLLLLGVALPPIVGRSRAIWACFLLATSLLVIGVAKIGVVDGALLPCCCAVQIGFLYAIRGQLSLRIALLMWLGVVAGGLLKGPPVFLVLLTTPLMWALLNYRKLRGPSRFSGQKITGVSLLKRTRPLPGLLLILLLGTPWLIAITRAHPQFLTTALWHDVLVRSGRGLEGHGQPPGFHLLTLAGTFFPWSIILPGALYEAWRRRRLPWVRLCLAAVIGPWIVFEIVATKLPHYLLIIFPMLAILVADWIVRVLRGRITLARSGVITGLLIAAGVAAATGVAPPLLGVDNTLMVGIAGTFAMGWIMLLLLAAHRRDAAATLLCAGAGTAVVAAMAFLLWIGRVPMLTTSQRIAAELERAGITRVEMLDYKEPSLAWYAEIAGIEAAQGDPSVLEAPPNPCIAVTMTRRGMEERGGVPHGWTVLAAIPARLYNDGMRRDDVLLLRQDGSRDILSHPIN